MTKEAILDQLKSSKFSDFGKDTDNIKKEVRNTELWNCLV